MSLPRNNNQINQSGEITQSTNQKVLAWLQRQQQKLNSPRDIIIPSVIEAAIMTSCAGATYYFIDKESLHAYNHPFTFSSVFTLLNTLLHCPKLTNERKRQAILIACGSIFAINDALNRLVLTHESGHAFTCFALFKNANPTIKIFPELSFNKAGGYTSCNSANRSDFAIALGDIKTHVLFSSSGTIVNMLLASIMLIVAELLPTDYFESKCYLRLPGATSIIHAVYYALSALWLCDSLPGHDFCNIQNKSGVTAVQSAMIIFSIGAFVQLTLSGTSYLRKKCKENASEYNELTNEHELATIEELNEPEDTTINMPDDQPIATAKM